MLRDRFELVSMAEEYVGKYISSEYLRKNILQQSDEQIKEIDKQIAAEKPEEEDWWEVRDRIRYIWAKDSHFMELKNSEIMRDRFELVSMAEEYVGRYISAEYLRKNILQQSDEQMKEIDKQMAAEKPEEPEDEMGDDEDGDEDF